MRAQPGSGAGRAEDAVDRGGTAPANPARLAAIRARYADTGLDDADLDPDPLVQFARWLEEVVELGVPEPNAMVLSTADAAGWPSSRHVLLKGVDAEGFVFFTNYRSRKALDLAENPRAGLCFPWFSIGRQVVVTGVVAKTTRAETEEYFASRPRDSQLGAWASERQSEVVGDRGGLDARYEEAARRFAGTGPIPAPPYWGGFRLEPLTVEFWQGRRSRMHDRLRYRRDEPGGPVPSVWIVERLSP